jgi:alcohol dehydrogenase
MKALVFETFGGPLAMQSVPDPVPPADGVVIGVRATGLCRSDWHGWIGHDPDVKLPHVPGHEFAGVIEEVGPRVTRFRAGDRVTVPFCVGCGTCVPCREGHQQVCDRYFQPGFTAWGSFAERVAIPHADANVVSLPDSLDFVSAASLGCRFVTSYRALAVQGELQPGQWVAIHGCGGVGLSAVLIAKGLGARVIGIDVNPAALELATSLGADHVVRGDATGEASRGVVKLIREYSDGGVHVSVDAIGSLVTCLQSVRCLRKRGCHVQVGLMVGDECNAPIPMHVVIAKELKIVGSHGMAAPSYAPLLQQITEGRFPLEMLVRQQVPLHEFAQLLPRMPENHALGITVATAIA